MKSVGVYEAKTHLSELLQDVAKGESIEITKHGVPLARIVPIDERRGQVVVEAVEFFQEMRKKSGKLEDTTIRELIEEGRRY